MSNRFPADDEHLNPYPGNLKHHKVDAPKREPFLSDDAMVNMCEDGQLYPWQKEARMIRDFYEAARAKDAELIQRLVNGLEHAQKLRKKRLASCDKDLKYAAAAGYKPTTKEQ